MGGLVTSLQVTTLMERSSHDLCDQIIEFHYFHQYGVRDRVNFSHLSEAPPFIDPDAPLNQLIPTFEDDEALLTNFKILVTHVLVRHMRFFSSNFSDVVVSHIRLKSQRL